MTRSSSINNGARALGLSQSERSKESPLRFSDASPVYISDDSSSFHSFKTQHATIIQHSSTVGAGSAVENRPEKDEEELEGKKKMMAVFTERVGWRVRESVREFKPR